MDQRIGNFGGEICIQMCCGAFSDLELICSDRVMSGSIREEARCAGMQTDANFPVHYINIRERRRVVGCGGGDGGGRWSVGWLMHAMLRPI